MMNYAVVGVGYFGAELARIIKEQEDAQVVAVYDPENGETIAKELSCRSKLGIPCIQTGCKLRYRGIPKLFTQRAGNFGCKARKECFLRKAYRPLLRRL